MGTWESYCIFLELLTGLYMTVGLIDSAIKAYPYMDLWLLWDILSGKSLAFRLRFITNGTQFSGLHSVKLIQRFGYLTSKKHM